MKRRQQEAAEGDLPSMLAAGPDPACWSSELAWRCAGRDWSEAHGHGPNGWLRLLPSEVAYAVSALGRAHRRLGGLRAPWLSGP